MIAPLEMEEAPNDADNDSDEYYSDADSEEELLLPSSSSSSNKHSSSSSSQQSPRNRHRHRHRLRLMVAIVVVLIWLSVGWSSERSAFHAADTDEDADTGTDADADEDIDQNQNQIIKPTSTKPVNNNARNKTNSTNSNAPFNEAVTNIDKDKDTDTFQNRPIKNKKTRPAGSHAGSTATTTNSTSTHANQTKNNKPSANKNANANANANANTNEEAVVDTASNEEPVLTLLVMLSGEFGNNLFKIMRGWGTAELAQRDFGLNTRLVFAQQRSNRWKKNKAKHKEPGGGVLPKAKDTAKKLERCFLAPSYFRDDHGAAFALGNKLLDEGYFQELDEKQIGNDFTLSDDNASIQDIRDNLKLLVDYLRDHPNKNANTKKNNNNKNTNAETNDATVTIPRVMVRVNSLVVYSIVNEFYEKIRETFVFDDQACCGKTLEYPPGADETVLHLRNFATEMKEERRKKMGFEEMASGRLANEVLGHLKEGDKIALAGRRLEADSQTNGTEAYALIQALHAKNLTLRFAPGSASGDGMEDFCFLTHAQKELVGTSKSTFLQLAAYMAGESLEVAKMYQFVTPAVTNRTGSSLQTFRATVGSNWTHPDLRARVRFEEYF